MRDRVLVPGDSTLRRIVGIVVDSGSGSDYAPGLE